MPLKEIKKSSNKNEQKKVSPRERSVLSRYGIINKTRNTSKARTINELYDQRYKIKNH